MEGGGSRRSSRGKQDGGSGCGGTSITAEKVACPGQQGSRQWDRWWDMGQMVFRQGISGRVLQLSSGLYPLYFGVQGNSFHWLEVCFKDRQWSRLPPLNAKQLANVQLLVVELDFPPPNYAGPG